MEDNATCHMKGLLKRSIKGIFFLPFLLFNPNPMGHHPSLIVQK